MRQKAWIIAVSAVAGALACAVAASAVLPPQAYIDARHAAVHHLQARIDGVEGPGSGVDHGACLVDVEVLAVFRGGHQPGDRLTLAIDCAKPGANLPAGPVLWTSLQAIQQAGYVEAYLDADGSVAGWQTVLLSAPSDEPECKDDDPFPC